MVTSASLPSTSRAAVLTAPMTIEMAEFPIPDIGSDDALLAVEASGVCGSDIEYRRHPRNHPRILGHEVVGRIARIGDRAAGWWGVQEGDRVAVEAEVRCGSCAGCLHGVNCASPLFYGNTVPVSLVPSLWGGFADYMYLAPRSVVTRLPENVSAEVGGGWFSPMSNAVDWVGSLGCDVQPGDTTVILGPGPQGIAGCVVAKSRGAASIIVVGLRSDRARMEAFRRLGVDAVLFADEDDVQQRVRDLTAGRMADNVLDVTGAPKSVALGPLLVRRGGAVSCAGPVHYDELIPMPISAMVLGQVRWIGQRSNRAAAAPVAADLLARYAHELEPLVTHRFTIDQASDAIDAISPGSPLSPIKVVVCP